MMQRVSPAQVDNDVEAIAPNQCGLKRICNADEIHLGNLGAPLSSLRNVGKATLADLTLLNIHSRAEFASRDPDDLYVQLQECTGTRHDPCVRDVFAAAIHECRTGEPIDWWVFTRGRVGN